MTKPITVGGETFEMQKDLAKKLGKSEACISLAIKNGRIEQLFKPRGIPITFDGIDFPSLAKLAKYVGKSKQYVSRMRQQGKLDSIKRSDEKNRSIRKPTDLPR